MKACVIGGGIAGLTAAYRLIKESQRLGIPLDVKLLEGTDRVGGTVSTQEYDGAIIENGPDSFITTKPAGLELVRELGLGKNLIETNKSFRRAFVAFNKKLRPIPEGFFMLAPSQILPMLESSLFSHHAKAQILMEPFVPVKENNDDESLANFVRRRFGKEVLDRIAQPMMAGVYTADPEKLSLRSTMPQFLDYERKYGSVIVGLQEEAKAKSKVAANDGGARYSMFVSLDRGMQLLTDTLAGAVNRDNIRTNTKVTKISRNEDEWVVETSNEVFNADSVIIATPSYTAAELLKDFAPQLASELNRVEYASSVVLNMVFRETDFAKPLEGFGFVVPVIEKRNIIACSYSSIKFANRAPNGCVTLRVFLGGALRGELATLSASECLLLALKDLNHYLGLDADPIWYSMSRWKQSMPQYDVGHHKITERVTELCNSVGSGGDHSADSGNAGNRGASLFLAGNAYSGVGLPDCIRTGNAAALSAIAAMQSQFGRDVAPATQI